jgi:hypothetical protein
LKSAPPEPPAFVEVPPLLVGVVWVGVADPPVLCGVVVAGTTGVAVLPPDEVAELDDDDDVDGVAVVVVEVVVVAELDGVVEAAGVPPDGGAVSAGVSLGRL